MRAPWAGNARLWSRWREGCRKPCWQFHLQPITRSLSRTLAAMYYRTGQLRHGSALPLPSTGGHHHLWRPQPPEKGGLLAVVSPTALTLVDTVSQAIVCVARATAAIGGFLDVAWRPDGRALACATTTGLVVFYTLVPIAERAWQLPALQHQPTGIPAFELELLEEHATGQPVGPCLPSAVAHLAATEAAVLVLTQAGLIEQVPWFTSFLLQAPLPAPLRYAQPARPRKASPVPLAPSLLPSLSPSLPLSPPPLLFFSSPAVGP